MPMLGRVMVAKIAKEVFKIHSVLKFTQLYISLKSFAKLTLKRMIAIIVLFYYNDVSMLLASFSS